MQEEYYAYWLESIKGVGSRTIDKLINVFGTPKQIYAAKQVELNGVLTTKQTENLLKSKEIWKLEQQYEKLKARDISYVWVGSKNYPQRLKNIPDAPFSLFYRGCLPKDEAPAVAIIGARDCSQYGSYIAAGLGQYLGERGVAVISGMARGIDGESQKAVIKAGGSSFGVLGSGVDVCYPASNKALYDNLIQRGGVISTYPPGTLPAARNFPPRNRIVSGLCDALVVIEARNKSGTLITVDMALEQGKDVYVVPGRITDRLSDGCNMLLKQGAGVFLTPQDFYEELIESRRNKVEIVKKTARKEIKPKEKEASSEKGKQEWLLQTECKLPEALRTVYQVLDFMPRSIDEIKDMISPEFSAAQISIWLMRLCMEGYVVQVSPGQFCIKVLV